MSSNVIIVILPSSCNHLGLSLEFTTLKTADSVLCAVIKCSQ